MAQARLPGWQVSLTEISGIGRRNRAISRCGAALSVRVSWAALGSGAKGRKHQITCWNPGKRHWGGHTLSSGAPGPPGLPRPSAHLCILGSPGGPGSYTVRTQRSISPSSCQQATVTPTPSELLVTSEQAQLFPLKDQGADAGWTWVTQRCLFITIPEQHNLPCST